MQGKRILVTGGAGFIGSNLSNHLAKENEVIAIDNASIGTPRNLDERVHFEQRDVLESHLPTDVDLIFHLAALSSYQMHEGNSAQGSRINVEGFINTVEQARKDGCETIVYASTSSIYGSQTEPSPENMDVTINTGMKRQSVHVSVMGNTSRIITVCDWQGCGSFRSIRDTEVLRSIKENTRM